MALRVARFNGDVRDLRLALVKGQGCEGYQLSLAQAISSLACLPDCERLERSIPRPARSACRNVFVVETALLQVGSARIIHYYYCLRHLSRLLPVRVAITFSLTRPHVLGAW